MQAPQTASHLEGFRNRGAGTDAERRAAGWLARELAASGRQVVIETFWCRPNWALAHAWHIGLALGGSLASVGSPRVGGALLLAALVFTILDELTGVSPGRRLTPERASQNIVALTGNEDGRRLRLILTANYDAGRSGIAYRDAVRRPWAGARRLTRRLSIGWLGWLAITIVWLEVIAILRIHNPHGHALSIAQLPPTIALVLALALLLDLAIADVAPAAGDNGTGVGVLLALMRALDTARHGYVSTDVVLTGAGDSGGIGLRRYLRAHRRECLPDSTAFLGLAACPAGALRWWRSDGPLVPYLFARTLRGLAADVAAQAGYLGARQHHGRGSTPALRARMARIPALTIGCLDERGLAPRSHQHSDTAASVDPAPGEAAVQFGLMLVDAIESALAAARRPAEQETATPA